MTYLDVTLPTLADNLALDEALLLEAEENARECLRTWEWPSAAVVLGAAGKLANEVFEDACRRDGVPIQRRSSGGGTVLLGQGCLCFSLVLSYDRAPELTEVTSSYRYILGLIARGLSARIPGVEAAGTSDLAVQGRKFPAIPSSANAVISCITAPCCTISISDWSGVISICHPNNRNIADNGSTAISLSTCRSKSKN